MTPRELIEKLLESNWIRSKVHLGSGDIFVGAVSENGHVYGEVTTTDETTHEDLKGEAIPDDGLEYTNFRVDKDMIYWWGEPSELQKSEVEHIFPNRKTGDMFNDSHYAAAHGMPGHRRCDAGWRLAKSYEN